MPRAIPARALFVEGARRDTRDSRGLSGQLGVWRPRYAGWGWRGGLFLKANNPNLSGGQRGTVDMRPFSGEEGVSNTPMGPPRRRDIDILSPPR